MQVKGLKIGGVSPASTSQNSAPKKLQPQDEDAVSVNLRRAKPSAAPVVAVPVGSNQGGGGGAPQAGGPGGETN